MAIKDVLDDGEAETGAALFAARSDIDAVEALGQPREMLGRDTRSLVDHGDGVAADLASERWDVLGLDANDTSPVAVFEGVLYEVLEYLHQLVAIAAHDGRPREASDFEAEAHLADERFERVLGVIDNVVQVDEIGGGHMGVHLDPAQGKQRIDQPRHARGLLRHDREEALARARVLLRRALQRLDEAAQGGERGPQLVARI